MAAAPSPNQSIRLLTLPSCSVRSLRRQVVRVKPLAVNTCSTYVNLNRFCAKPQLCNVRHSRGVIPHTRACCAISLSCTAHLCTQPGPPATTTTTTAAALAVLRTYAQHAGPSFAAWPSASACSTRQSEQRPQPYSQSVTSTSHSHVSTSHPCLLSFSWATCCKAASVRPTWPLGILGHDPSLVLSMKGMARAPSPCMPCPRE